MDNEKTFQYLDWTGWVLWLICEAVALPFIWIIYGIKAVYKEFYHESFKSIKEHWHDKPGRGE